MPSSDCILQRSRWQGLYLLSKTEECPTWEVLALVFMVLVLRHVTQCRQVLSKRHDLSTTPHNATPRRPDSSVYHHQQRKLMFSLEAHDVHAVWSPHHYVINYVYNIFSTHLIMTSHCEGVNWFICCNCVAQKKGKWAPSFCFIFFKQKISIKITIKNAPDKC
jgi:hypothetical protein